MVSKSKTPIDHITYKYGIALSWWKDERCLEVMQDMAREYEAIRKQEDVNGV